MGASDAGRASQPPWARAGERGPIPVGQLRVWRNVCETIGGMPDAGIRQILESDEPLTCQECDFRGRLSDLERQGRSDGWEPLTCPSCGQDHYLFGPDPISKPLSLGE